MALIASIAVACLVAWLSQPAEANVLPYAAVGGFSTPGGRGFWIPLADGPVLPSGTAGRQHGLQIYELNGQIVGGAATPTGRGYWLVGSDGGVFSYGDADYHGSLATQHLNRPAVAIAPTGTGHGYWITAGDGGVFTFGDAHFRGSAARLHLASPIVGFIRSGSGRGYRLVGQDGGIFDFGTPFLGSLPGRGVHAADVIGGGPTSTNHGYWIARRNGTVYGFGDARRLGSYAASSCDPVTAIVTNPHAIGYRLVMQSGATVPFGHAPGGIRRTGHPLECPTTNDLITTSGRIGPLQIDASTEADVRAYRGDPDATSIGSFNDHVLYPDFRALGYDCSSAAFPGSHTLHPYEQRRRGPYCRTIYFLNTRTQRLAGLETVSTGYHTAAGTHVGTTVADAARLEHAPFYPLGCFVGLPFGDDSTAAKMFLFTDRGTQDVVASIGIDSTKNPVGVLFC